MILTSEGDGINIIFSNYQTCHVVEWWVNRRFEDHLSPRHLNSCWWFIGFIEVNLFGG